MNSTPGCYGAISVFSRDSNVCRECGCIEACGKEAMLTLESIRGLIDVSDIIRKHDAIKVKLESGIEEKVTEDVSDIAVQSKIQEATERISKKEIIEFSISSKDEAVISAISAKNPKKLAETLCKSGLLSQIREDIKEGRNAMSDRQPRFVAVAIDCLIAGGFTRKELKSTFIERLDWTEGSALSHVGIVLPVLTGFGLAQEIEGRIVVNPDLRA